MNQRKKITKVKKIKIIKFRGLKNIDVEIGGQITAICGKNGTSKSSILGILAQIFTFREDYTENKKLQYRTIADEKFESGPENHFRLSKKFDLPGSMKVRFHLHDGYTKSEQSAQLELITRGGKTANAPRPQVRQNHSIKDRQDSRSFTHPVIFLSLNRLMPIPMRAKYDEANYAYLESHSDTFKGLSNRLLGKSSSDFTSTKGVISSSVTHGTNYDHESVSAGEDNAGQIILALMSFQKLRDEMGDEYKGGMLLIDEADAGLFPAAQLNLIDILIEKCKKLFIQVVITTHSPTLIEQIYELQKKERSNYKLFYLTDTFGEVEIKKDWGWREIYSDIHIETIPESKELNIPKINVYFEDEEAYDFYNHLLYRRPEKRYLNPLKTISLGCSNYINLVNKKVHEFSKNSLIILDGDVKKPEDSKTIVLLPTKLAPDQLVFQFLYNLEPSDTFWINPSNFTKPVFLKAGEEIISRLNLHNYNTEKIDLYKILEEHRGGSNKKKHKEAMRDLFKRFYNSDAIQKSIKQQRKAHNIWHYYIDKNMDHKISFINDIKKSHLHILNKSYGINSAKLKSLWLD